MEKTALRETALRALSILGLVAVLLLGAWGIIQIAFVLSDFFTNLGTSAPKEEQLAVTLPSSLTADKSFSLAWKHQNGSGAYSYAVSYSCANGLSLQVPLPTGATQEVKCNTPFNYTNATDKMDLTAKLTGKTPVSTTFTVSATKLSSGAVTAHASSTATIAPAGSAAAAPASSGTAAKSGASTASNYVSANRRSNLSGFPDLSVRILSAVPQGGGRYSVQFVVENLGTNVAPAGWSFSANLPTTPAYAYPSGSQQALYPGDKIVYTLGFDAPTQPPYLQQYNSPQPQYYPQYSQPSYSTYYPYANCGYTTNYVYNGVYNYPVPNYGCTQNTVYGSSYGYNYSYPYTSYSYPYATYSYPYSQTYTGGTFSVSVTSLTAESSTANNVASIAIQ